MEIEEGKPMQIRTAIGFVAAFTAAIALVPMSAKAVCTQVIYADRSFSDGANAQIVGRVNTTDNFAYFAATTNNQIAALIFSAVAQRNRVYVVGSAASCPTTGDLRDIGNVLQIFQQP
jgi:hypothetical protein